MKEVIHRFFNSIQKFKYAKACVLSFVAFIITSVLMFVTSGVLSSFFCSVCAGILTGFVFFLISGLKAYDEHFYSTQNEFCSMFTQETQNTISLIEKIFAEDKKLSYAELQSINYRLCDIYVYYTSVVNNVKDNKRYIKKSDDIKSVFDELGRKLGFENSIEKCEEIYLQYDPILRKIYNSLISLLGDFVSIKIDTAFTLENLKNNRF